jgi:hypothetical protein
MPKLTKTQVIELARKIYPGVEFYNTARIEWDSYNNRGWNVNSKNNYSKLIPTHLFGEIEIVKDEA